MSTIGGWGALFHGLDFSETDLINQSNEQSKHLTSQKQNIQARSKNNHYVGQELIHNIPDGD